MKIRVTLALAILTIITLITGATLAQAAKSKIRSWESRIDPELLAAYKNEPPLDLARNGLENFREFFSNLVGSPNLPSDPAVTVYDLMIPGPNSGERLRLRIYKPIKLEKNSPGIYWIHGGGFLFGEPEQDEAQSLRWAKEVGAVVVAVDYRLAPEHPYPAALDDCYAGLVWFAREAKSLGVDKNRLAVAGASAGGGLTAAVALKARDLGSPSLAFQAPLYPMIDDRFMTPASREDFGLKVWNNTDNLYAWKAYLGEVAGTEEANEYMAPARAKDLSGLPPTYTCVGDLDPFRDDAINYVARLAQARVPVEFHLYPGAYHAFELMAPEAEISRRAMDEYVSVLKKVLKKK
jgi:acetyl esterase/lipase